MIKSGNVTVYVSDLERAVGFYTQTLGLQLKLNVPKHWAQVEAPGISIGLHPASDKSPRPGRSESLSIGFGVDNLNKKISELKQKGVQFAPKIQEDGPVRLAFFSDLDGNPLYLVETSQDWGDKKG